MDEGFLVFCNIGKAIDVPINHTNLFSASVTHSEATFTVIGNSDVIGVHSTQVSSA